METAFNLYTMENLALLVSRLVLGSIFLAHGWPKITSLKSTIAWFDEMGFKPAKVLAPLVAIVECFGGIALLVGVMTHIVAGILLVQFLVINIWRVVRREPLVGGRELDLVIFALLFMLVVFGAGTFSLDAAWF